MDIGIRILNIIYIPVISIGIHMIEIILWISLGALVLASAIPKEHEPYRFLVGGAGWALFALHWLMQPPHFIQELDYANVVLVLLFAMFCLFVGYTMVKTGRAMQKTCENNTVDPADAGYCITDTDNDTGTELDITPRPTSTPISKNSTLFTLTRATALSGLFYFPFANIPLLNQWIISLVTNQTLWLTGYLGYPAIPEAWNQISLNGNFVEIILACTAIESIALFMGLIFAVNVPTKRMFKAFMVSIPVIYILNILRDVFVIIAYGQMWFGAESFTIAHHIIAKAGSGIALFIIAYAVLKTLPELLDMIEGIWVLIRDGIHTK